MYLSRTPLRISLFGGGTDYEEYYARKPGAVIGMAINKYINIAAIRLSSLQEYRYRVSYSRLEMVKDIHDIQHDVVRECLKLPGYSSPIDISVIGDLPSAGSGLGSSSSFTVGLLNLLKQMYGKPCTKIDLATCAIHLERNVLKENGGVQDQLHAAFGGINRFDFSKDRIQITPLQISGETYTEINQSMVLVHTGIGRKSTEIAAEQKRIVRTGRIDKDLSELYQYVTECVSLLEAGGKSCLQEVGSMLNESWAIKRSMSGAISNTDIDDLYAKIIEAGAYGAKLCGAGGGGYFAVLIDPKKKPELRKKLPGINIFDIQIDVHGSTILQRGDQNSRAIS